MKDKIGFIVANPDIGGGTYVIYEHAIRINRRNKFSIIMLTENRINENQLYWHPEAKELEWKTIEECENTEFHTVISTWWPTCYELYRLKSKNYLYFNQSVESRFYKNDPLSVNFADSTYMLNLPVITEATWIKEYLKTNFNIEAFLARNGIRKDIYTIVGPTISPVQKNKLRVLVEGPLGVFFKNTERTIDIVKKTNADEVWLLTSSNIDTYPGVDRVFSRIPIFKTPEIYRSCDVIVKLSYIEGMFGPPLEMFHCGGTAIVYNVTGHDEYIIHNHNGFVVEKDNEDKVVDYINLLKSSPEILDKLKANAIVTANNWHDWDQASLQFEKSLDMNNQISHITQKQLLNRTTILRKWYELAHSDKTSNKIEKLKKILAKFPPLFNLAKSIYRLLIGFKNNQLPK